MVPQGAEDLPCERIRTGRHPSSGEESPPGIVVARRPPGSSMTEDLKSQIVRLARDFSAQAHRSNLPGWDSAHTPFDPGVTTIPYAGRVFDSDEVAAAIAATLDFWLTLGPEGDGFEQELASFLGIKRSILVNSGSSANLVAF